MDKMGVQVDNLSVADVAYPLSTSRVMVCFSNSLYMFRTDADTNNLVQVGTTNYHNTGHHLNHYQSLHGTSKVETVHSVLDHTLIPTENSCCLLDPFLSVSSCRS